jgi:hypothetical protein
MMFTARATRRRELHARKLQMKCQPRFLHRGQRNSLFRTLFFLNDDDCTAVLALQRHDPCFEPAAEVRRQDVRPPTNEPSPLCRGPQHTFTRRRHLQLVVLGDQRTTLEQPFDRSRRDCAVGNGDRRPIPLVDPNLDQQTRLGAAFSQLDKIVSDRVKSFVNNAFQLVLHTMSRGGFRTKKCGEHPPHSKRGKSRAATCNLDLAHCRVKLNCGVMEYGFFAIAIRLGHQQAANGYGYRLSVLLLAIGYPSCYWLSAWLSVIGSAR